MGAGISPFDKRVKQHSLMQAEVMMHLRFPKDAKDEQDGLLERDQERLDLMDAAMYGDAGSDEALRAWAGGQGGGEADEYTDQEAW